MKIIRRQNGAIVSTILVTGLDAATGKIKLAAPVNPVAATKPTKPAKDGKARKPSAPQAPKDASDGAKLAFKLNHYRNATDITDKDRWAAIYKLGKDARDIGPGDPDVQAALQAAKADQARHKVDAAKLADMGEHSEGNEAAWYTWGTYFVGGYVAHVPVKQSGVFKRYLLTVTIDGNPAVEGHSKLDAVEAETFTARHELFQAAHRAACRWFTVKSDVAHRMSVTIDTLRPEDQIPGEPPVCIPSLRTIVDFAEARDHAVAAERRQNKGPTMFTAKGTQTLRLSLPTCHESRSTFSSG